MVAFSYVYYKNRGVEMKRSITGLLAAAVTLTVPEETFLRRSGWCKRIPSWGVPVLPQVGAPK